MNNSEIVTDLLHKLSKNEFLTQDGGKSRKYRNQLNSMYGSGDTENKMTDGIIADIGQLVPLSVLEQYISKAESDMNALRAKEAKLTQDIADLEATRASGDTENNARIRKLEVELETVKAEEARLKANLEAKETELKQKASEISSLIGNIQRIKGEVDTIKSRTIDSDPVKTLLERLRTTTATATQ